MLNDIPLYLSVPVASFFGGLFTHIAGSYVFESIKYYKRSRDLKLEGTWIEKIDRKTNQYSHSTLTYDKRQRTYLFNGTNYFYSGRSKKNGSVFSEWDTISSVVDEKNKKFYYFYHVETKDHPGVLYYGVGVINLELKDKVLRPTGGHFSSPELDGETVSYSLIQTDIPYARSERGNKVIASVKNK